MPPPYEAVGQCIYCPATVYSPKEPTAKLGDEHIIARLIKGRWILPEASCQACEAVTSGIETECGDTFFLHARAHMRIKSRKGKRSPNSIPTNIISPVPGTQRLQIQDHPGALFNFKFDPPNLLRGLPLSHIPPEVFLVVIPLVSNMRERLDRFGPNTQMQVAGTLDQFLYARLLAKIAHAYAVAECKLGGFQPLLLDLIRNRSPLPPWAYVGSATDLEPPAPAHHQLGTTTRRQRNIPCGDHSAIC